MTVISGTATTWGTSAISNCDAASREPTARILGSYPRSCRRQSDKVATRMWRSPFLLTAASLLALCTQAQSAITLVAQRITKDLTGAENYAVNAPGYESKAGNFIAVWTVTYSGGDPVGLVSDSAGNTYKPAT